MARLRIEDTEAFLGNLEKIKPSHVYVDSHTHFFATYYHVWLRHDGDMIEVKIKYFDALLWVLAEISRMKIQIKPVRWIR